MRARSKKTLLEAALDAHMTYTGAYERQDEDHREDLRLLKEALETWAPSHNEKYETFDNAVKALCQAALAENWKWFCKTCGLLSCYHCPDCGREITEHAKGCKYGQ